LCVILAAIATVADNSCVTHAQFDNAQIAECLRCHVCSW
jgi:hypothetical protein